MKCFEADGKYNFVDKKNVFVGYDSSQHCCEDAGYYFCQQEPGDIVVDLYYSKEKLPLQPSADDLEPYSFDKKYGKDIGHEGSWGTVFKLKARGYPDIFLVLFNHHNGYYSHGFEFGIGKEVLKRGSL